MNIQTALTEQITILSSLVSAGEWKVAAGNLEVIKAMLKLAAQKPSETQFTGLEADVFEALIGMGAERDKAAKAIKQIGGSGIRGGFDVVFKAALRMVATA